MNDGLFAFGKYSAYIWSAYGLSALVLAYNVIAAIRKHRRIERALRVWLAAGGGDES
jgi:heme exporter protein CcmD